MNFKIYYESGKLEAEMKFDESCNCNQLIEYFESGKTRSTKTYLDNGLIDGADIVYHSDVFFLEKWFIGRQKL